MMKEMTERKKAEDALGQRLTVRKDPDTVQLNEL